MMVSHRGRCSLHKVDPLFTEVCEQNSLQIMSAVCSEPAAFGAGMDCQESFFIKTSEEVTANFTVIVSGIRKGFAGRRFAERTKEEFERNMNFWANI